MLLDLSCWCQLWAPVLEPSSTLILWNVTQLSFDRVVRELTEGQKLKKRVERRDMRQNKESCVEVELQEEKDPNDK